MGRLGPGLVTGAANVDPSLVVTATVVGAAFGYSLLWVVVLCVPFLLAVFQVSARLGFETRKGLVDLLREHYGRGVALGCAAAVVAINMAMIIADLLAVTDALSIILNQRRIYFVAAVAFTVWYILIFRDYRKITKVLLWLSLPLYVYVVAAIIEAPSPQTVLWGTIIPHVQHGSAYAAAMVAIFGSLLTPYVVVWQTSSRSEACGQRRRAAAQLRIACWDGGQHSAVVFDHGERRRRIAAAPSHRYDHQTGRRSAGSGGRRAGTVGLRHWNHRRRHGRAAGAVRFAVL